MKRWILLGVFLLIFFCHTQKAEASEESRLEELDFTKIQEVLEETFWERVDGSDQYHAQRADDLNLLRTVVADKRMSAKAEAQGY